MSQPPHVNPYAAPGADIAIPSSAQRTWIEQKALVVPKDWQSPAICLRSGATTDLTPVRKKRLSWSNPAMIVLIFLGIIGILALVLLQKRGTIYYYLSKGVVEKMRKNLLINCGFFGLGVCLLAFELTSTKAAGWLVLADLLVVIISAILGLTWCRPIKTSKIDKTHIWLTGIPPEIRKAIVRMEQENLSVPRF